MPGHGGWAGLGLSHEKKAAMHRSFFCCCTGMPVQQGARQT
jgi:hypothetical protein